MAAGSAQEGETHLAHDARRYVAMRQSPGLVAAHDLDLDISSAMTSGRAHSTCRNDVGSIDSTAKRED